MNILKNILHFETLKMSHNINYKLFFRHMYELNLKIQ